MGNLQFSDRQQSMVTSTVTLVCGLVVVAMVVGLVMLLIKFLSVFGGILMPLAVAAILALVLKPYYEWLLSKVRYRLLAVLLVYLSLLIPIVGFMWGFGAIMFEQLTGLVARIPDWIERVWVDAQLRWPTALQFWNEHGLGERLHGAVRDHSQWLAQRLGMLSQHMLDAGAGVFRAGTSLLMWVVFPIYFGYFLVASPVSQSQQEHALPFFKPSTRADVIYLGKEFVNILVAYFRCQVVIALLMGVLYAVGYLIVGLQFGMAIGLLMGFLNVIPYLGSIVGFILATVVALTQSGGGISTWLGVLLVVAVVQALEGNLLTPKIMGQRTGLHPVTIMVAIMFWGTALGGLLGMVLAVPLTAFLVVFWRLAKTKYIREVI